MLVLSAFALVLVFSGDSSAGYSQGSSSHVAPKKMMNRNSPAAAPFALSIVPGMRQPMVISIATACPADPIRKRFLRPARSMKTNENRVERA